MYIMARCIIGFGLPFAIVAGSCLIGRARLSEGAGRVLTSLFNACFFIGAIVAAGITYGTQSLTTNWSWRIPSLLQMAPSVLQVSFVFFLPESPRFLVSKDKHEEALQVLIMYHGEGQRRFRVRQGRGWAEIKTTITMEMEHSRMSWLDMVRSPGMRRRVLIGSLPRPLHPAVRQRGHLVLPERLAEDHRLHRPQLPAGLQPGQQLLESGVRCRRPRSSSCASAAAPCT